MGLCMDTSPTHHIQPALQETPSRFSCSVDRHQAILLSAQAKVYISTCVRGTSHTCLGHQVDFPSLSVFNVCSLHFQQPSIDLNL